MYRLTQKLQLKSSTFKTSRKRNKNVHFVILQTEKFPISRLVVVFCLFEPVWRETCCLSFGHWQSEIVDENLINFSFAAIADYKVLSFRRWFSLTSQGVERSALEGERLW